MVIEKLKSAAKIVVSLTILALLLKQVPLSEVVKTIPNLGAAPAAALSIFLVIEVILSTLSIYVLITHYTDIDFAEMFKIDAMNFIANTFIPSRLGSMVSMPLLIDRYTTATKSEGVIIQTTQMVLATLITGATAGVGWALFRDQLPAEISTTLALCVFLYLGFPAAVTTGVLLSDLPIVQRHITSRLPTTEVRQGIQIAPHRLLVSSGCLLATRVGSAALRLLVLSITFSLELGVLELLFVPALMYSVTVLPISVGGIGLAEASGTLVLSALGVPVGVAATVIFVDRIFVTYLPLLVFYVYVTLTGSPKRRSGDGSPEVSA